MSLVILIFAYVLLCVHVEQSETLKLNKTGENLRLKPDTMDLLIMEERESPEYQLIKKRHEELGTQFKETDTKREDVSSEVDANAVVRKVWSRWSKWGECSATCGHGVKTRRRLCLSGHCAPGEREEQRLPCCRQPCEFN